MYWHILSLMFLLAAQLFTTITCDHKRVVVHVPYRVKTIHHKHTVVKPEGGGGDHDDYVIGYSDGIESGNMQPSLGASSDHNFGKSYGGGHGQNWLQASQGNEETVAGFGGEHNFGTGLKELNSYQNNFGVEQGGFVNQYFSQDGFDTSFKQR